MALCILIYIFLFPIGSKDRLKVKEFWPNKGTILWWNVYRHVVYKVFQPLFVAGNFGKRDIEEALDLRVLRAQFGALVPRNLLESNWLHITLIWTYLWHYAKIWSLGVWMVSTSFVNAWGLGLKNLRNYENSHIPSKATYPILLVC